MGQSRVGPDFLSAIADRVGSTSRRVGSGRSKKSDPVDNCIIQSKITVQMETKRCCTLKNCF